MPEMLAAAQAEKRLVNPSPWRPPPPEKSELKAVLEIEAVIQRGISFRARCDLTTPGQNVALMLLVETTGKPRPFARIDWRSSRHDNLKRHLCGAMWRAPAGRTHFHDIALNQHLDLATLFGDPFVDLPAARKIDPEPPDFRQLLEISAILLNISNLATLPDPPWQSEPLLI